MASMWSGLHGRSDMGIAMNTNGVVGALLVPRKRPGGVPVTNYPIREPAAMLWPCAPKIGKGDTPMTPRDQLAAALKLSGMTQQRYASEILLRPARTLRRWLTGDSPIPQSVIAFLNREKV